MAGYENLLAVAYHNGPSIFGCQSLRVKIIQVTNRDFKTIADLDCPISRNSNMVWMSFSEQGYLVTFDTEGVVRTLILKTE